MEAIIVCNTGSDTVTKVELGNYNMVHAELGTGERKVGPHGIDIYGNEIITANNYNNTISFINLDDMKENYEMGVGAHPNDIKIIDNWAYVICGESNSVSIIDLLSKSIAMEVKVGEMPHNICIDKKRRRAYITSIGDNIIWIIDCNNGKILGNIKVPMHPTKILLSGNGEQVYVCESYLGQQVNGYIRVLSNEDLSTLQEVNVGDTPIDMYEDYDGNLYVSNFLDGSISIVDTKAYKEIGKIYVGGMPKGIVKNIDKIIVGDYFSGNLKIINLKEENIKTIAVGREPSAIVTI